jgi:hypothetical protein
MSRAVDALAREIAVAVPGARSRQAAARGG